MTEPQLDRLREVAQRRAEGLPVPEELAKATRARPQPPDAQAPMRPGPTRPVINLPVNPTIAVLLLVILVLLIKAC
jgi:hypothetical protein